MSDLKETSPYLLETVNYDGKLVWRGKMLCHLQTTGITGEAWRTYQSLPAVEGEPTHELNEESTDFIPITPVEGADG